MTFLTDQIDVISSSGEFDRDWYLDQYRDVAMLRMDAVHHYVVLGALIGRNPNAAFDTRYYLKANPDVGASPFNPFFHYLTSGRSEGRHAAAPFSGQDGGVRLDIVRPAQFRVDRNASIDVGDHWVVFVAYSASGRLSDCQRYQIACFGEAGYRVALIVNTDSFFALADPGADGVDIQIVRENIGFDFGAWRHAVQLIGGLRRAASVTFTNDSVMPAGGASAIAAMRTRIAEADDDILFLTRNREVRPHTQSYLFTFGRDALDNGALGVMRDLPVFTDKDRLIHEVEIKFSDILSDNGFSVGTVFDIGDIEENPTIHHWEKLLDGGFPFIKVQLITAGLLDIDDPRLAARLGDDPLELLRGHCAGRVGDVASFAVQRNVPPAPAFDGGGLFNQYGAQQAYNPPAAQNPTIAVPLPDIDRAVPDTPRILAIIHGFYVDIAEDIVAEIALLAIPMRVIVTTDTDDKRAAIDDLLARYGLDGRAVLAPNRGRDVAPFIIEGAKYLDDADIILHLHTKKSPHDSVYAGWSSFLRQNLIGSGDIVRSILRILQDTDVGMVYSDHFSEVVGLRNWGFDFQHTRRILDGVGCAIDADTILEFPTSTMFWAKRAALDPLFALGLDYRDFEPEAGQVDGTLAHGIERSLLYIVEQAGYSYTKVTASENTSESRSPLLRLRADELEYAFARPMPRLTGAGTLRTEYYDSVPEIYPVGTAMSRNDRPRLTALLPTMQPEKIYGGITTALTVIRKIAENLPDGTDLRILITSDTVDQRSVEELSKRLGRSFTHVMPDDDVVGSTIVGVAENQHIPIGVRRSDMFVATAWWTADLGFRLLDRQGDMFGGHGRMTYIIQDFEPGFYNWSNKYALAEGTYHRGADTIAIINSEELSGFMTDRYDFAEAFNVPYELHPRLRDLLAPTVPQKLILAYGRPGVGRNCFELICEGLRLWQARDPQNNTAYEIVFAGEEFDKALLSRLVNASNVGKLSIEDYAATLNRAAIGLSLMISPHPSYPPLEMASAGCITISNRYDGKDLRKRSANFVSLDYLSPAKVADALDIAVQQVCFDRAPVLDGISAIPISIPSIDYARVAGGMTRSLADRRVKA